MIEKAEEDMKAQIQTEGRGVRDLKKRYPKARNGKFDQRPGTEPSELDALVAYLQILGQIVDFTTFDAAGPNLR
jgi:cytochrome c oxidase cbb3-type subunit 2